jgi:transposase InsO family protein
LLRRRNSAKFNKRLWSQPDEHRGSQHEFLNETLFRNLAQTRDLIVAWVNDDNTARPHSALGYQTPAGFALRLTTAIARPAARDEGSARRAIAQTTPKGGNQLPAPVAAG